MTDTPDPPKYLPGLEGDPEGAILENWTEQDWEDWYETSVATFVGGGMLFISDADGYSPRGLGRKDLMRPDRPIPDDLRADFSELGYYSTHYTEGNAMAKGLSRMSLPSRIQFYEKWEKFVLSETDEELAQEAFESGTTTLPPWWWSGGIKKAGFAAAAVALLLVGVKVATGGSDTTPQTAIEEGSGDGDCDVAAGCSDSEDLDLVDITDCTADSGCDADSGSSDDTPQPTVTVPEEAVLGPGSPQTLEYRFASHHYTVTVGGDGEALAALESTDWYVLLFITTTADGVFEVDCRWAQGRDVQCRAFSGLTKTLIPDAVMTAEWTSPDTVVVSADNVGNDSPAQSVVLELDVRAPNSDAGPGSSFGTLTWEQ